MLPPGLLLIQSEPTDDNPFLFSARIKLNESLKDILNSSDDESGPTFLTQSIATGVWRGAYCTITALSGKATQGHRFHDTTTWGDFLRHVYDCHPSGAWRDLRPGETDFFPDEDWEYYDVQVSLFWGAKVE